MGVAASQPASQEINPGIDPAKSVQEDLQIVKCIKDALEKDLVLDKGWLEMRQSFKNLASKVKMQFYFEPINTKFQNQIMLNYGKTYMEIKMGLETDIYGGFSIINEAKHQINIDTKQETNLGVRLKYWIFELGAGYRYKHDPKNDGRSGFEAVINIDISDYF